PLDFGGAEGAAQLALLSGDARRVVMARGATVVTAAAETGRQIGAPVTLDTEPTTAVSLLEGTLLAVADEGVAFWNLDTGEKLGRLSLFEADAEWVFHRDDGRFDATVGAQDRMYFQQGDTVLPLASLFEETFTSDLLAGLLAGHRYAKPDLTVVAEAPTVSINLDGQARGL